jgi:glucokinase
MVWSIGIDLGGTNIAFGLVDENRRIVDRESAKTQAPRSAESLVETMVTHVKILLDRQGLGEDKLEALGIGLPGVIDPSSGLLVNAVNLGLRQVDFVSLLQNRFPGLAVRAGNDGDAAAWGEYLAGEGGPWGSVLMLTLGTGVGGGLVYDGRIFRGGTGLGIEPGHLVVQSEGGLACTCGRSGCLEVYTSIRGLNRLLAEALEGTDPPVWARALDPGQPSRNVPLIVEAARAGDQLALGVLDRYTAFLASGLRSLIMLYRPHRILLGGGISHAGEVLLKPLHQALFERAAPDDILSPPPVRISRLGNDAGIIGAALLHLEGRI